MHSSSIFEIGLAAWIVQDGNYPDFEVGMECKFALEVGPDGLILSNNKSKSINRIQEGEYEFDAEILLIEPRLTVLDAGILCYHDGEIAGGLKPGDFVSGELYLGVDPFFWSETHALRKDVPNLFYRWIVREILLETTAWQESNDPPGQKYFVRVAEPRTFKSVGQTNAWEDDSGNAHYILRCELLESA